MRNLSFACYCQTEVDWQNRKLLAYINYARIPFDPMVEVSFEIRQEMMWPIDDQSGQFR